MSGPERAHPFRLDAPFLKGRPLRAILEALNAHGEARVVGGAVRDAVLGLTVGDIDLATDLVPDRVAEIARQAGMGVHETGLAHGTLTVVAQGVPFEVTTLRRDVSTDGRRATVAFTTDWALDAGRRDFTMNALYLDAEGNGTDYFGGFKDCLSKRVRFIGDPHQRILEDHLRILRFVRFNAVFGGAPDPHGLAAAIAHKGAIANLARERVFSEVRRIATAPHATPMIALMSDNGLLAPFVPGALTLPLYEAYRAAEERLGRPPCEALGLLAMVGFDGERFAAMAEALRMPGKVAERALEALQAAQRAVPAAGEEARALLYDAGAQAFVDALAITLARGGPVDDVASLLAEARGYSRPRLPVDGRDLIARGVAPGPELGERLARLEALWRESDFTLSREALLQLDAPRRG